jgi:Spy/CpxP family protein refolding chaperone
MRALRVLVPALALVLSALGTAGAQNAPPPNPPPVDERQRDSLESQVRVRMMRMLRQQLGLSDEQVRRLGATNRRFEGQRRALFEQERRVRFDLRQALGDGGDTTQVATLLDSMLTLQRERVEMMEAEQRELATFLTPVQRARLVGLEEQIRRRMMEMRDDRGGPDRGAPDRPPSGGGRRPGTPRPPV